MPQDNITIVEKQFPNDKFLPEVVRLLDEGHTVTLLGDGNLTVEKCRTEDIKGSVTGFYRKGRDVMDRTDGMKWRVYSYIWTRLRPVRRYLLAFHRRIWMKVSGGAQ